MTIESRIAALEAELAQLKTDLAKSETADTWPKDGDEYWVVDESIDEGTKYFYFHNDEIDQNFKATGNMFRTREEALQEFEHRKTIALFRSQPGRKVFKCNDINLCFVTREDETELTFYNTYMNGLFQTYFDSNDAVENAIKAVGEGKLIAAAKWYAERV